MKKNPTRSDTMRSRKFARQVWPLLNQYFTKLFHEKTLGRGSVKGGPFSKQAWVDTEYTPGYFYITKMVTGLPSKKSKTYTQMVIAISITPRLCMLEDKK